MPLFIAVCIGVPILMVGLFIRAFKAAPRVMLFFWAIVPIGVFIVGALAPNQGVGWQGQAQAWTQMTYLILILLWGTAAVFLRGLEILHEVEQDASNLFDRPRYYRPDNRGPVNDDGLRR